MRLPGRNHESARPVDRWDRQRSDDTLQLASGCGMRRVAARVPTSLFDDFIGPKQNRFWNSNAESFGCSQIYSQLELGRLLDRNVTRLCAFEDFVHLACGFSEPLRNF